MLCTNCGINEASFHYKQIVNGKRSEQHLCAECASKLGYVSHGDGALDFGSILNDFISLPSFGHKVGEVKACPVCKTTFAEFKKTGLLGCDRCYDEFKDIIESTLSQIQPSTVHKGKLSGAAGEKIQRRNELDEMKENLKRAILDERYEEAAVLRDKIKKLEQQGGKENG